MTDFNSYRLPFGGIALEPLSEKGKEFLANYEWEDSTYHQPDACMTGLPESAIGFGPFLISEIAEEIRERGLTSKAGS